MFTSFEQVKDAVEGDQGVLTLPMEELRDAAGASKLGKHILANISNELAGQGLGHYPNQLPNYQHEYVRIFKLGSPVADIIKAVFEIGEDNDELLRQAAAGDDAILLRQIRGLLCS